jgi:hypothetical protein
MRILNRPGWCLGAAGHLSVLRVNAVTKSRALAFMSPEHPSVGGKSKRERLSPLPYRRVVLANGTLADI